MSYIKKGRLDLGGGVYMSYLESGCNNYPPIIFSDVYLLKEGYTLQLKELACKFHVFAIDPIGFGESSKPNITDVVDYATITSAGPFNFQYSFEWLANWIDVFITKKGLNRVNLSGLDFMGNVMAKYALMFPNKVDRLLLENSGLGAINTEDHCYNMGPINNCIANVFVSGFTNPATKNATVESMTLNLFSSDSCSNFASRLRTIANRNMLTVPNLIFERLFLASFKEDISASITSILNKTLVLFTYKVLNQIDNDIMTLAVFGRRPWYVQNSTAVVPPIAACPPDPVPVCPDGDCANSCTCACEDFKDHLPNSKLIQDWDKTITYHAMEPKKFSRYTKEFFLKDDENCDCSARDLINILNRN